jgi:hypothetical protein
MGLMRVGAAVAVLALFLAPLASAHAIKPAPRVVVSGSVLLGNVHRFSRVAVVDRKAIFEQIPAVKTIRRHKLAKNQARYHFLVLEANRVFRRTLARVAREHGVDLVVTKGGVRAAGIGVADLTSRVRKAVASP